MGRSEKQFDFHGAGGPAAAEIGGSSLRFSARPGDKRVPHNRGATPFRIHIEQLQQEVSRLRPPGWEVSPIPVRVRCAAPALHLESPPPWPSLRLRSEEH